MVTVSQIWGWSGDTMVCYPMINPFSFTQLILFKLSESCILFPDQRTQKSHFC